MLARIAAGLVQGLGVALRSGAAPLVMGLRWAGRARSGSNPDIPPHTWDIRLVTKAALDEIFFTSEVILADIVSRQASQRFSRELPDALELFRESGWLDDPASYHRDPPAPEQVRVDTARTHWLRYSHVRFESGYEPHAGEPGRERWLGYAPNRTAHAWVLEHEDEPRPWLVCVPGYRMGHPLVDFIAFRARWLHRELGLNVAVPVMPLHGPRRIGRRGGDGFFSGDFIDTVHAQTQAVWDVRRLLGWLRQRGAPALGVYGVSLGGCTTALTASLEDDLDCVIAGVPAVDFLRLMKSQMPDSLLRVASWAGFSMDGISDLLRVISPLDHTPRVPKQRRFVYAGLADQLATPDQARDLWEHWERPGVAWYRGSHVSFLWEKDVTDFLRGALHLSGLL